jgi:hypothetical protein
MLPIAVSYPVSKFLDSEIIWQYRYWIKDNSEGLLELYNNYRYYFFNNNLPEQVTLGFSKKLTASAGQYKYIKGAHSITFSKSIFDNVTNNSMIAGGIQCADYKECLQLVLEHELIHMLIRVSINVSKLKLENKKVYSSHGLLFKSLVKAYFGQTKCYHELGKPIGLSKNDVRINDCVSFEDNKGVIIGLGPCNAKIYTLNDKIFTVNYALLKIIVDEDLNKLRDDLISKRLKCQKFIVNQDVKHIGPDGIMISKFVKVTKMGMITAKDNKYKYQFPYYNLV